MLSKEKVSIAMATYNGENFIAQQIESIFAQTYKDFELIICDDSSTDRTIQIIQTFMKKHSNIKLFQNQRNIGYLKNFEKLINLCKSDYIALSDQDDIWIETKLEIEMKELLKIQNISNKVPIMVHSDLMMINQKSEITQESYFKYRDYKLKKTEDLGQILGPCGVMGNTLLFNKYLKDMILPFPDTLENHDYWIAVVNELFGKRVTINRQLVQYRIHDKNTSNSKAELTDKKTLLHIIKKYLSRDVKIPYIDSKKIYIVKYILDNFHLKREDTVVLKRFHCYLKQKSSKSVLIYYMISENILKRDFLYRLKFIIKQLVKR